MQILITIILVLSFAGCTSQSEKLRLAQEQVVQVSINADWHNGLPLMIMNDALEYCRDDSTLEGCDILEDQLLDVAISFATCKQDDQSNLCRDLVKAIKTNPISKFLKTGVHPLTLPHDPFYWNLPTRTINDLSSRFEYRTEAVGWWWKLRKAELISIFLLLLLSITIWGWHTVSIQIKNSKAAAFEEARIHKAEIERQREIFDAKNREQIKREFERARDAEIMEQQRIVEKNHAELQKAIADAAQKFALKKEAEAQAETSKLLDAVFTSSQSKSKKNRQDKVPSSAIDKLNS